MSLTRTEHIVSTGQPHRTAERYSPWSLVVLMLDDDNQPIEVESDPDGWLVDHGLPAGVRLAVDYLPWEPE